MKIITLSQIGYNSPSQANWSYGVWKLDLIDTERAYCMSYTLKENFGDYSRFGNLVKSVTGHEVIETKGVYPSQRITGIRNIDDLESDETLQTVKDFLRVGVNYETNEPIY